MDGVAQDDAQVRCMHLIMKPIPDHCRETEQKTYRPGSNKSEHPEPHAS